ncbi:MAG: PhnD/SsuA/transferrin family substrate-binding protein, partial [Pseudomonadota bacterium]
TSDAGPSLEEWRKTTGIFRIGAVTRGDSLSAARVNELILYLQRELSMPVDLFEARDATAMVDAIASGEIDYAVMSGLAFATAQKLCGCVQAIASPTNAVGETHIETVLLAPPNMADGVLIAGPAEDFATGLVPAQALKSGTSFSLSTRPSIINADSLDDLFSVAAGDLRRPVFAWHYTRKAGSAVADGSSPKPDALAGAILGIAPDHTIIWQSDTYRIGPHAIHESVPSEIGALLATALSAMRRAAPLAFDSVSPGLSGDFVRATSADYENYQIFLGAD